MSNIQNITESFKGLSVEELLAIIAAATAEAKKSAKAVSKAPKEAKEKKGSMPKGVSPPQLHKPRAWVDFVLAHANANGWPAITVKDAEALPASVERDGKHVFEATGKPLNNKHAMSLSKQYWARKEAVGSNKALYDEFEAQYVAPEPAAPSEPEAKSEANSEAPKEANVAEAPKKEKKAAAAPKKTEEEKEAEKARKAAEKEAEKARKEAEKLAAKEAAAAKKAAEKAEKPKKVVKKAASPKAEEVPPFEHEDDGFAHPWDFKGKKYLRDFKCNMWFRTEDGESAGWAGKFDPVTNTIDASAEEPEYEDEE
jgi:hypothetical protein